MPLISVKIIKGRTAAQKRALITELANGTVRALGVDEQSVRVIITEIEPEHWGIGASTKAERDGGA